jgi:TetR/AcrR family transcriptional repressor of lmrAB and yxaGH operons
MGSKGDDTKARLLDAARDLAESGGYYGAGLNHIIAESGAPRGSVYFHFPGGKDQLISEALARSGHDIAQLITGVQSPTAEGYVTALIEMLADRLEASGWRKGCPVATVALDVASSNGAIQRACSAAYASWEQALRDRLAGYGCADADELAVTVLALVEGALILARARRSREPLARARHAITRLL